MSSSSGSNSGPTNPDYLEMVADRVKGLRDAGLSGLITADLVQASASGLDPHITLEASLVQIPRVDKARRMSDAELTRLVAGNIEDRQLFICSRDSPPRKSSIYMNTFIKFPQNDTLSKSKFTRSDDDRE